MVSVKNLQAKNTLVFMMGQIVRHKNEIHYRMIK